MKHHWRRYLSLFWVLLGGGLMLGGRAGVVEPYWGGAGFGLLAAGILQLVRHIRYRTNEEYRERVDVSRGDERNKYLASKAWAWTGYLFVLISAIAHIALRAMGEDLLADGAAMALCLQLVLYWVSYLVLKRKY